jgi:DNA end-binding protein Ku
LETRGWRGAEAANQSAQPSPDSQAERVSVMASSTWKGYLTFGLVSIPIRLYPAARSTRIEFHQLHKPCRTRLRRPLFCPTCNRMVEQSEVVKGYEYEKGQYLLIEDQEIKKLAPDKGGTMEIGEFVPLAEIDPLYYDDSYLAIPDKPGQKAYSLLVRTMEETDKVALATVVMRQREYVVAIRTRNHGLTMHTLYFADEIREVPEYGQTETEVKPEEVKLAKELVGNLTTDFKPEKYHDEYKAKLQQLLDARAKGKKVSIVSERKLAPVIDMMDALKQSLAKREARAPKAQRGATRPQAAKARRRAS